MAGPVVGVLHLRTNPAVTIRVLTLKQDVPGNVVRRRNAAIMDNERELRLGVVVDVALHDGYPAAVGEPQAAFARLPVVSRSGGDSEAA